MNVHSLSNPFAVLWGAQAASLLSSAACRRRPSAEIPRGSERLKAFQQAAEKDTLVTCDPQHALDTGLSRFCIRIHFQGVLRHDRHRLGGRDQTFKGKRGRLSDELPDRGDGTDNAHRINRCLHYAPAFLFRADQEPVDRLSFVLHNFKTPRSSRFV
jgi:hypothetical protein